MAQTQDNVEKVDVTDALQLFKNGADTLYAAKSDLSNYVATETGKGLSSNDFSDSYKSKLDSVDTSTYLAKSDAATIYAAKSELNSKLDSDATAASATKAAQDGAGNIIANTYLTKSDAQSTYVTIQSGKGLSSNDFTTTEKNKLAGIADNANNYTLPAASNSQLGGVKIGSNISINNGTISLSAANVTSALGYTPPQSDTNSVTKLIVGASNSTVNASTSNGNTYLRLFDDNTARNSIKIAGSGAVTVSSDNSGNITVGSVIQGLLTLSSYSLSLARHQVVTVSASSNCSGAVSASSANTSIATVSVSGNSITITAVASGSTSITVSQAADSTYSAPSNQVISVFVSSCSTVLNENTWAQISEISKTGQGDLYWDIGDAKEITLNGNVGSLLTLSNTKLCVFILHFNYAMNGAAENNIIWSGFKSALTNGVDVTLIDAKYNTTSADGTICFNMNHWGNNNYGGWKGCDLRYDILGATSTQPSDYGNKHTTSDVGYDATAATLTSPKADTLLAALPSDFRNALRLWTRWVDAVGNGSNVEANIHATVDAITLLAAYEIFGSRSYANNSEQSHQTQMAYYAAGNSKKRYTHNDTSAAVYWWEGSPNYENRLYFCRVDINGNAGRGDVYCSRALAPAFKT